MARSCIPLLAAISLLVAACGTESAFTPGQIARTDASINRNTEPEFTANVGKKRGEIVRQ